ncbi:MAG: GGDEF domain-containing protein [Phycisphaerales bacterium]
MNPPLAREIDQTHGQAKHADRPDRFVLIGASAEIDQLCGLLETNGKPFSITPTYLSALGELSSGGADVLIGPADTWQGSATSIVRSARTLAPGVKLVALCDKHQAELGREAIEAGFDDVLYYPLETQTVRNLIDPAKRSAAAAISENAKDDIDEELGDIDMVDALLSPKGDVADIAVRLIASHSGLRGIGLRPADGEAPQGDASVVVRYQGKCLGRLYAPPPATEEQLAAWGDWLGRWLALRGQLTELRDMALCDELTGIWNRRYFNRFLERILDKAASDRSHVTLLVFDIDDFKLYNDKYGHGTGDEVLRETAKLMLSVVREHDVVARIGGDEFAVIFWDNEKPRRPNSEHPQDVVSAARRFQEAICSHRFPKLMDKAVGRLTVSGGLASFPWDGRTPSELLARADAMALQSKRLGKNAITFGTGSKRPCLDE